MKPMINKLDKISVWLNKLLIWAGGFFLVAMIVLCCANIALRLAWLPIRGTFELMGFFGAVVCAFALGRTQSKGAHIAVNILIDTFSEKTRRVLQGINHLICMLFFALVAWQVALKAATLHRTGEVTETLRIVYYPFTYAVAFGCLILTLIFLVDLLKLIFPQKEAFR
jgi:TRAP-type C4-dicarboxylate transport system permease small subunit